MTLRNKMILGGIAAVVIPVFIAGIIAYAKLSTLLESLAQERVPAVAVYQFTLLSGLILLVITICYIVLLSKKISSVQGTIDTLKQITRNMAEVVLVIGPDKRIKEVNRAMVDLMKCPADEIIGTRPVLTNSNDIPEETIWHILDEGKSWVGRVLVGNHGVDQITLEVLILPIRDAKGIVRGYIEIGRNITNELTIEQRLKQAQKTEAIGALAGGIAHDFNNVLTGIFGYAELCLYNLKDEAAVKSYLEEVLTGAQRARELVRQLLTFSRKMELELKPFSPKYTVKEAVKLLRASIPPTIELQTLVKSDAAILGEPTQLHRVVTNLCTNAAYAMKDSNGILGVTLEEIDVDEEFVGLHPSLKPGKHILLAVSDTGGGIKPELLDHIFDPFFTTKPTGEGTGLGLSVVDGIVKKLKGVITVNSEVSVGTTFNVIIPVSEPPAANTPEEASDTPHQCRSLSGGSVLG